MSDRSAVAHLAGTLFGVVERPGVLTIPSPVATTFLGRSYLCTPHTLHNSVPTSHLRENSKAVPCPTQGLGFHWSHPVTSPPPLLQGVAPRTSAVFVVGCSFEVAERIPAAQTKS